MSVVGFKPLPSVSASSVVPNLNKLYNIRVSKQSKAPAGGSKLPGGTAHRRTPVDTKSVDAATTTRKDPEKKTRREVWHPPLTAEKRAERVRLARAFLAAFGQD